MTPQLQEELATAPSNSGQPLISVVIATRNRADMLLDSIHSVLCQTYRNIEVVVVDDGSEDNTHEVVANIDDSRVRYVHQQAGGISSARNRGTAHARGSWLAVHDDDDIMLPKRLEEQMKHADDTVDFVYGAFINFDDDTGALELHHGRNYGYGPALMSGFAPGHSTWLVRADVMRQFPYDEGIESAVDNNVVFRMLRSGVRFRHSGVICLLRRVHAGRITNTGGAKQKYVAGLNLSFIKRGVPEASRKQLIKAGRYDWGPVDKTDWETRYLAYLPDHLVKRTGYVTVIEDAAMAGTGGSTPIARLTTVNAASMSWRELLTACSVGADTTSLHGRLQESPEIEELLERSEVTAGLDQPDPAQDALRELLRSNAQGGAEALGSFEEGQPSFLLVAAAPTAAWSDAKLAVATARCVVSDSNGERLFGLVPLRSWIAAAELQKSTFGKGFSVRIYSTASPSRIAAELSAAS